MYYVIAIRFAMHTKILFYPSMCSCNVIVEPPMPDPKPKKCSEGIPCTQYYDLDDYDHPDCGESDYGTSVCDPNGYKLIIFSYYSHYNIQTVILFKGQFEANIL